MGAINYVFVDNKDFVDEESCERFYLLGEKTKTDSKESQDKMVSHLSTMKIESMQPVQSSINSVIFQMFEMIFFQLKVLLVLKLKPNLNLKQIK